MGRELDIIKVFDSEYKVRNFINSMGTTISEFDAEGYEASGYINPEFLFIEEYDLN